MSGSGEASLKIPEQSESFEERIDMLFEELAFAFRSQRPSILLVSCEAGYRHDLAELALEKCLAEIGHTLVPFPVDEVHFDIPLLLYQRPDRDSSVYSVRGLARGGGKAGANAYRSLNMRRELFVDHTIRIVFWLTRDEAVALSLHAPDFWAFRHRVLDFNDFFEDAEKTQKRLKQSIAAARDSKNTSLLARLWGDLGQVYLNSGLFNRAARAYWKAIRLDSREADLWHGLGHFYHVMDRYRDAIMAYQQAIMLDPHDPSTHLSLMACYRLLGKSELAKEQEELVRSFLQDKNDP